jgi:hypothetical protein
MRRACPKPESLSGACTTEIDISREQERGVTSQYECKCSLPWVTPAQSTPAIDSTKRAAILVIKALMSWRQERRVGLGNEKGGQPSIDFWSFIVLHQQLNIV